MIGSQVSGTVPLTTHFSGPPVNDEWTLCSISLVECSLFLTENASVSAIIFLFVSFRGQIYKTS